MKENSLLFRVAQAYAEHPEINLSSCVFVFPNGRMGRMFQQFLAQNLQGKANAKPIFAPLTTTLTHLFETFSDLQPLSQEELLFRLYKIVNADKPEAFDSFYFWGKMLLSDFNEVDLHLVNAEALFRNIQDLKEIENTFALDLNKEENSDIKLGLEVLSQPAQNDEGVRAKFIQFWAHLGEYYKNFRETLQADGVAYNGMLQRSVVENLDALTSKTAGKRYVFIGFNNLTQTERRLMTHLHEQKQADFYFDYAGEYLEDAQNRASLFKSENESAFPSQLDLAPISQNTPLVHWYKIPSSVGQADAIYNLLSQMAKDESKPLDSCAIVLPDNALLLPLLQSIPQSVGAVNVTMGLPFTTTPLFVLLQILRELHDTQQPNDERFYYTPVLALLNHPYLGTSGYLQSKQNDMLKSNLSYVKSSFFKAKENSLLDLCFGSYHDINSLLDYLQNIVREIKVGYDIIGQESKSQLQQMLTRLQRLMKSQNAPADVSVEIGWAMVLQHASALTLDLEGNALSGLQIMGVLEARGMDFDHLILPDFNDDKYPGSTSLNSYIPYALRCAFGLPTEQTKSAVATYNFYRLFSHSQEAYLLQNTLSDNSQSGEESRFLAQLKYQYGYTETTNDQLAQTPKPILVTEISYPSDTADFGAPSVEKTTEVMNTIEDKICKEGEIDDKKKGLSPSSLNTYLKCPLQFYLGTIRGLKETPNIEEGLEDNTFGTIVHNTMQMLYKDFEGKPDKGIEGYPVYTEDIDAMQSRIKDCLRLCFQKVASNDEDKHPNYLDEAKTQRAYTQYVFRGQDELALEVMETYVKNILAHDKTLAISKEKIDKSKALDKQGLFYIGSEKECRVPFDLPNGKRKRVYFHGFIDRIDKVGGQLRIVDYKTGGSGSNDDKLGIPKGNYFGEKSHNDHTRQLLIYCLLYEPQLKAGEDIKPCIYYVRQDPMEKFINKDKNLTYLPQKEEFKKQLTLLLEELLDEKTTFDAKIDTNSKGGHCGFCPFTQFCGITLKQE